MPSITISTCVPLEAYKKIKMNYWKVPELILLGIRAKEGNPQMIERIREVELLVAQEREQNRKLVSKLQAQAQRLYELESKP